MGGTIDAIWPRITSDGTQPASNLGNREGSTLFRLSSVPGNFAPRLLWLRWALCLAKVQLALWLVSFTCAGASADVGGVLNESLDEDVDRLSSPAHSAIYFSRV